MPERMSRERLETRSREDGRPERGGRTARACAVGGESPSLSETERPRSLEVAEPGQSLGSGLKKGAAANSRMQDECEDDFALLQGVASLF